MSSPPFLKTPAEYKQLIDSVDTFLFDCDGVIYHGPKVVEGVKELLDMLRASGKRILFVTNNSTKSRRYLKETFDNLGLGASLDECFGSAYASAVYLAEVMKFPKDKKVYVFGHEGLEEELDGFGIAHCGGSDPEDRHFTPPTDFASISPDGSVGAVLCGADSWINYKKICKAVTYLRNPECALLVTNMDANFPTHGGLFPAGGSICAPILTSSGRTPLVIGKPSKHMMDALLAHHHIDPSRTLMVGDNLYTDVAFGRNSGIRTLLVMGGVTSYEDVYGPGAKDVEPDMVIQSLGDLRMAVHC
ncbi:hypothetical protein IAT38_003580 [Cryptococcus sp. DSM 104549]